MELALCVLSIQEALPSGESKIRSQVETRLHHATQAFSSSDLPAFNLGQSRNALVVSKVVAPGYAVTL